MGLICFGDSGHVAAGKSQQIAEKFMFHKLFVVCVSSKYGFCKFGEKNWEINFQIFVMVIKAMVIGVTRDIQMNVIILESLAGVNLFHSANTNIVTLNINQVKANGKRHKGT